MSSAAAVGGRAFAAANEEVRVAVLGAGWRGGEMAKAFSGAKGARLVAIADPDSARAEKLAQCGLQCDGQDRFRDLLASEFSSRGPGGCFVVDVQSARELGIPIGQKGEESRLGVVAGHASVSSAFLPNLPVEKTGAQEFGQDELVAQFTQALAAEERHEATVTAWMSAALAAEAGV